MSDILTKATEWFDSLLNNQQGAMFDKYRHLAVGPHQPTDDLLKQMYLGEHEPDQFVLSVKNWKRGDKYDCPKCGNKIAANSDNKYLCEDCNIHIKPVMKF
jgi:ribosomal protein S27AE